MVSTKRNWRLPRAEFRVRRRQQHHLGSHLQAPRPSLLTYHPQSCLVSHIGLGRRRPQSSTMIIRPPPHSGSGVLHRKSLAAGKPPPTVPATGGPHPTTGEVDMGAGGASHSPPNQCCLYPNGTLTPDQCHLYPDSTYTPNQRHVNSNTDDSTTTNEQHLYPDRTLTPRFVGLVIIHTPLRRGRYSDTTPGTKREEAKHRMGALSIKRQRKGILPQGQESPCPTPT